MRHPMLKKLFLLPIVFLTFVFSSNASIQYFGKTAVFKKDPQTPASTRQTAVAKSHYQYLIAWDLHDVILIKGSSSRTMNFITAGIENYGIFSNMRYLRKIRSLKKRYNKERQRNGLPEYSWEELLYVLLRSPKEKERFYGQYILDCIKDDGYVLDPLVAQIIHDLACSGHQQAVLSNMNPATIALHTDLILTQGAQTGLSRSQLDPLIEMLVNQATRVIPQSHNNWSHKPEGAIYHEFLTKNVATHQPGDRALTVFIDDKEVNVKAALACGFDITILYTNPHELRQALIYLEIL